MNIFYKLWIGEMISNIGTGMSSFAISVYVYEKTNMITYTSLITLLAYLPNILLSPVAGILADRYDRRAMMIAADLLSGLGVVFIFFNLNSSSILPIFVGVTISSLFSAFSEPAYRSTITDIVIEEDFSKASAMMQIAYNSKFLLSPILAGMLMSFFDIRLILLIDICTFFVTCIIIYIVKKQIPKVSKTSSNHFMEDIKLSIEVLKKNKGVLSLIFVMFFVCFFIGMLQVLLKPLILSLADKKTLGILESISASGMLISSILISILAFKQNFQKILSTAGIFCGIFMACSGVSTSLIFICLSIFLLFFTLPFMNTSCDVLVRKNIANEYQGKIWGFISLLTQLGNISAYLISGFVADYIFEPMFAQKHILSDIIGIGKGRGTGFMIILSGIGLVVICLKIAKNKNISLIDTVKDSAL